MARVAGRPGALSTLFATKTFLFPGHAQNFLNAGVWQLGWLIIRLEATAEVHMELERYAVRGCPHLRRAGKGRAIATGGNKSVKSKTSLSVRDPEGSRGDNLEFRRVR